MTVCVVRPGPMYVGELLTGVYGVVTVHGLYVGGVFLPGSMTYLHGILQVYMYNIHTIIIATRYCNPPPQVIMCVCVCVCEASHFQFLIRECTYIHVTATYNCLTAFTSVFHSIPAPGVDVPAADGALPQSCDVT